MKTLDICGKKKVGEWITTENEKSYWNMSHLSLNIKRNIFHWLLVDLN